MARKLSEPQMTMLQEAANSPNLRARAGHRKERTAQKLVDLGLGTISFYGARSFQINKAGLAFLGWHVGPMTDWSDR